MKDSAQLKRLGEMYIEQGDYESAELIMTKALTIDELSAPDTVALAEDLYNLGLLCCAMNKLSAARDYLIRSWKIERSQLGDIHPITLTTFNALSDIYRTQESLLNEGRFYAAAEITTASSHYYH